MNPKDVESFLREKEYLFGFLSINIDKIDNGTCIISFPWKEEFARLGNILHGGMIMSAMDYAGALAVLSVNDKRNQVTQELKINFIDPMTKGPFKCVARVVKKGKSTAVVDVEFYDSEGKLGAKGLGTWFLLS
ncbi:PaaI family thioesterase [Acidianus sp. RZ1]|uniref:PaaI family thioesterase n=1 Tax=Acidianus sp. RZ1 TaxID=1540082 RepID=UPI0014915D44|nr:PaaI family thioesterase [Acidianus sp. RZ1]NON63345.1 PaaI family thioesterase [Acidianus sp. RZ1]